jgi:hypothetical protein
VGREVVRRVSSLPGVESAALTSMLPVQGGTTVWIQVVGRPDGGDHNEVAFRRVTPAYFTTLRATLARGRWFTEADDASKPRVIIIDQKFAKKYFSGEDPIGQKIVLTHANEVQPMEIVGVVADIREGPLDKTTWPTMYYAFNQDPTVSSRWWSGRRKRKSRCFWEWRPRSGRSTQLFRPPSRSA